MAKKIQHTTTPPPVVLAPTVPLWNRPWAVYVALVIAVAIFYFTPLTSAQATPQWDTIDYHQGVLTYFFDSVRSLHLPYWTNFTYAGFPFLSDPQTGVWYPGNWILLVTGVGPKALELLLALHCLLAGIGVFLLASRWMDGIVPRLIAALLYMFSGFFAAHSSHLGMFETASWLPLLLYTLDVALSTPKLRAILLAGVSAGCMILVGHFQTALYAIAAATLYAIAVTLVRTKDWKRFAVALAGMGVVALLLSAVQWLPASALVPESARSGVVFSTQTNAALTPTALATLFLANFYNAASGTYNGPADITQFYYYGGLLLVPLAIAGLLRAGHRWLAGALVLIPIWFAFGPHTGVYDVVTMLPGFSSVRAPVHIWFVIALGLSLLAGAGAEVAQARMEAAWLLPAIALFVFADLYWWNSADNQLAYSRTTYEQRYGDLEDHLASILGANLPAGTRFHSPVVSASFGPMNGSLGRRLEVTYGYNPLPLSRYMGYFNAAEANPKLLAGLNAGLVIHPKEGTMERNAAVLPRFYFPRNLVPATGSGALAQLDPAAQTLVEGGLDGISQDPSPRLELVEQGESSARLRYQVKSPSLLRSAIPWFPGWHARSGAVELPLKIVDYAFLGVVVPAGSGEVTLEFRPPYFAAGAALSLLSLLGIVALLWLRRGA